MLPLLLALAAPSLAADPLLEARAVADGVEPEAPEEGGLRFIGLVQLRPTLSNVITTNPFLDGQVVGTLGGINGTTVFQPGFTDIDEDGVPDDEQGDQGNSAWTEQRVGAFFTYTPPTLDGRAALNAAFEIDFAWGDAAYGSGGNVGGGYGADQVNLQTRRLNAVFSAVDTADHSLDLVAGLQFVGDSAVDPARATPDDLFRTGAGLRFFGSEMAGLTAYGRLRNTQGEVLRGKLGTYTLVENGTGIVDDVSLTMLDLDVVPTWAARLGLHAWALRDRAGGSAGVLGHGPTSQLSGWQGGPQLDLRRPDQDAAPETDADLLWLGLDGGYNHALRQGPLGLHALAVANLGSLYVTDRADVDVQGWHLAAEGRLRWWRGSGSVLRGGVAVTGRDGTGYSEYTGVVSGNSYGIVGAVWAGHGCYLLLPDAGAINRQVAVVSDVSNGGDGLVALTGGAGADLVPEVLTLSLGGGWAQDQWGNRMGREVNGRLDWEPLPLLEVSAVAAHLSGSARLPAPAWTAFGSVQWLVF